MNLTLHTDMPEITRALTFDSRRGRREEQSFAGEYKPPITFVRAANVEKSIFLVNDTCGGVRMLNHIYSYH